MRMVLLLCIFFAVICIPFEMIALADQVHPPLALPGQQQAPLKQTPQTYVMPELEDIKGPVLIEEELPWFIIISALAIALIVLLLILFIIKKFTKEQKNLTQPSTLAYSALDLHRQSFTEHGKARVYVADVSKTVRSYIETEFHLQPTTQTTKEFIHNISKPSAIQELISQKDQLKELLELSDTAKFAHKPMDKDELEKVDLIARTFIQSCCQKKTEQAEGEK